MSHDMHCCPECNDYCCLLFQNIDLHALTGWIPDRTNLREGDGACNKDVIFQDLYTHFHRGNVLATLATGEMSDAESERTGLVSTHAYAILDIQEVKVPLYDSSLYDHLVHNSCAGRRLSKAHGVMMYIR